MGRFLVKAFFLGFSGKILLPVPIIRLSVAFFQGIFRIRSARINYRFRLRELRESSPAGNIQHSRKGCIQVFCNVPPVRYKPCPLPEEADGPQAGFAVGIARNGKNLLPLLQRFCHEKARPAFFRCLGNHNSDGNSRRNPVPGPEKRLSLHSPRRIFRNQCPLAANPVRQAAARRNRRAQHTDAHPARCKGALGSRRITALRQAGNHDSPAPGKLISDISGHFDAVWAGMSRADHSDRYFPVEIRQPALYIEDSRRGIDLFQPLRITRILHCEEGNALLFAELRDPPGFR